MDPSPPASRPVADSRGPKLGSALSVVSLVAAALTLAMMVLASRRGLDFTDEGFYLVSIADPGLYSTSVSQFGFVYHPLYELLGSDVVRMRQANVILTFSIALLLVSVVLRDVLRPDVRRLERWGISAGFASASLLIFGTWLITPSYNSLALQSSMLAIAGVVLVCSPSRQSATGWVLLGFGGAFTFLAKPTTAVALAVVLVAVLVLARRVSVRGIALTALVGGSTVLVVAMLIDGSVGDFVSRVSEDADLFADLDGGHSVREALRVSSLEPGRRLAAVTLVLTACLALGTLAYASAALRRIATLATLAGAVLVVLMVRGHASALFADHPQRTLLLLSLPIAAGVVGVRSSGERGLRSVPALSWILFAMFLVAPHAYAFGSNGNYWQVGGAAALFWALAALVLLAPFGASGRSRVVLVAFALVTQVLTATMLVGGVEHPYRQPVAIPHQDVAVRVAGSTISLGAESAAYIEEASAVSKRAGFEPGTPMIDLTGKSPTLLYSLEAKAVGKAWMIGKYPGSARVAVSSLELAGCKEVAESWLLTEPMGPRRISETVLDGFGITFPTDYERVGTWRTSPGAAGYRDRFVQELWKPVRSPSAAESDCVAETQS